MADGKSNPVDWQFGLGAYARSTKGEASIRLDQATVIGTVNSSVESFLGIPYAHPP